MATHTNGQQHIGILGTDGKPYRRDGDARPGGMALPFGWQFVAKMGGGDNTFWHDRWDEAMRYARTNAEAMRVDPFLMGLVDERKRACANLPWHLEVPDEKDPQQVRVRDGLTRLVKGIPFFRRILWAM